MNEYQPDGSDPKFFDDFEFGDGMNRALAEQGIETARAILGACFTEFVRRGCWRPDFWLNGRTTGMSWDIRDDGAHNHPETWWRDGFPVRVSINAPGFLEAIKSHLQVDWDATPTQKINECENILTGLDEWLSAIHAAHAFVLTRLNKAEEEYENERQTEIEGDDGEPDFQTLDEIFANRLSDGE